MKRDKATSARIPLFSFDHPSKFLSYSTTSPSDCYITKMSLFIMKRHGKRAVAGVAILVLSIVPLFQTLDQLSDKEKFLRNDERTGFKNVDLVKSLEYNASLLIPQLLPRELPAGITLSVKAAICQGAATLRLLNGRGNQKDANTPVQDLDGWTEQVG